jgi:hypothetical protein
MSIMVVRTLRIPRVTMAILVGAGLGMSGAALQGTMRNPLAEPYLLGVSGGAAVGAVIGTMLGLGVALLPVAAFSGSIVAMLAAFFVALTAGSRGDPRVLLMAGVVVGAFANAAIMVVLANAEPNIVRNALWWMMGSVGEATWPQIGVLSGYVIVGGAILWIIGNQIDVLALGDHFDVICVAHNSSAPKARMLFLPARKNPGLRCAQDPAWAKGHSPSTVTTSDDLRPSRALSTSFVFSADSDSSSPTGYWCGLASRLIPEWNLPSWAKVRARASASGGGW